MLHQIRYRLRALFRPASLDRELEQEMRHHAETHGGKFPLRDATAEACRDARGVGALETLGRDLRWSWRSLLHTPAFTIPALLTLALGAGAAVAIFSVAYAILIQPLAYPNPNSLVLLRERIALVDSDPIPVSAPDIPLLRQYGPAFDRVGAYTGDEVDLKATGAAIRLQAGLITADLFPLLGENPARGRGFTADDEKPGHNVVLLSDALWRGQFAADPAVVGRIVQIAGADYTIAGVMPRGFEFPPRGLARSGRPAALWMPLQLTAAQLADVGDNFDYTVLARLRPGARLAQAQAQMASAGVIVQHMWETRLGKVPGLRLEVLADSLRTVVLAGSGTSILRLLIGAAGLLLLLSCANTANLFLVRATTRRREWALRAALGAGKRRVVRQALTEAFVLALGAAALGAVFASACLRLLASAAPPTLPQVQAMRLNPASLLFAFALALAVGPLCGVLAARAAASGDLNQSLRQGAPTLAGNRAGKANWQRALVIAQVALAFVLVCGAGLLVQSLRAALDGGAGVITQGRLTATIALPDRNYNTGRKIAAFYIRFAADLARVPGVHQVGAATDLPTLTNWDHVFSVEGQPQPPGAKLPGSAHALVLGDYFGALGVPLLQGRFFTPLDQQGRAHVLLVSASLATRFWPGQSAVGHHLKWGPPDSSDPWLTIVGVVGDVKSSALDQAPGMATYEPYGQICAVEKPSGICRTLHLAVHADAGAPAQALRQAVAAQDPTVPVTQVRSLDAVLTASVAPRRFNTMLIAFFGIAALLLSAIGLYGVLAFVVAGARREIAVRLALGARPGGILAHHLNRGLRWAAAGLALGVAAAWMLSGIIASLLYNVTARDLETWAAAAGLLLTIALAASFVPALRASRTAPNTVLRGDS
ncbi:MAG TPA: ADOP family duplicated permease [Terriglobales bacterium]|jgi:predicted permease